ncbi:MAG: hypothetical protein ACE5JU_20645 [Candidatus Binatia bacterium]
MTKRRRRLTDHEKTIETLRVLAPTVQEALRTIHGWISIPPVALAVAWLLTNQYKYLIKESNPEAHNDLAGLEFILGGAITIAAVVPAAEVASKFIGPAITGLLGGGAAKTGAPIG